MYLFDTKLAKEIEQKRQVVSELSSASGMSAITKSDIDALQAEVFLLFIIFTTIF